MRLVAIIIGIKMIKWLHHLFNPHCAECRAEHECQNCNTLRQLLEVEKREKKELLEKLFPIEQKPVEPTETHKPLRSIAIPWRVKQQMLEQEDANRARVLKQLEEDQKLIDKELNTTSETKS